MTTDWTPWDSRWRDIPGTQADRLLTYLRANPGASSLEITQALGIVNVTGRVSDLRKERHVVVAHRILGVYRYEVIEAPTQLAVGL